MNKTVILLIWCLLSNGLLAQQVNVNELRPFVLIENNELEKALSNIDSLIRKKPSKEFLETHIKLLYKLERYNEAINYCYEYEKQYNHNSEYKLLLLRDLNKEDELEREIIKKQNTKDRLSLYELLSDSEYADLQSSILERSDYTIEEKQLYHIRNLIESKKYTQALFIADEFIKRNADNADVYFLQSQALFSLKKLKNAQSAIEKAIAIKRTNPKFHRQKAEICYSLNKLDVAIESVNTLIRKEKYNTNNYILKLKLLVANKQFNQSLQLSNTLLVLMPNNADLLLFNAQSHYKTGNHISALKSINRSLEMNSSKNAFELRGDIYMESKTYKYAEFDYSMFLDIDPYNGNIYAKKGMARFKQGDTRGACYDWKKAKRYGSYLGVKYIEKYCK
ncbi:MAG: tetratricopeptide repeat protein [Bacteroidales bacterium]|nr:tetratricopeptide repeat protein [Bacteroidales bacterium]